MSRGERISTSGGEELNQNLFGALGTDSLASGTPGGEDSLSKKGEKRRSGKQENAGVGRRRVDIRREKSGRGGKTVTVVSGLSFVGAEKREELARRLRKEMGVGGAAKGTHIELQGDQRDKLVAFFQAEGYRPVLAGG